MESLYNHNDDSNNNKGNKINGTFFQRFLDVLNNYKPLIILIIFCFLISIVQNHPFDLQKFMYYIMGYFFIFLSLLSSLI